MWQSNTDRQEANHHERQLRSTARIMFPMMDMAGLVERTPEANRQRAVEHERLAQAMAEHDVRAGERVSGVIPRFATWVAAHLAGVFRQRESSEAVSRR